MILTLRDPGVKAYLYRSSVDAMALIKRDRSRDRKVASYHLLNSGLTVRQAFAWMARMGLVQS